MRLPTSCHGVIVCVLAQALVLHVVFAAEPQKSSAVSTHIDASPPQANVGTSPLRNALPDDGPRYDRTLEGPESLQFKEAVQAFNRGQYALAHSGFAALATLDSSSALIPPLKAFLAELTLLEDPSDYGRREAIARYRGIIGSYPKNSNAFRALWRIGDLYVEMGWFQEALVAYEYALSRELPRQDADRSLLALGATLGKLERWTEAVRAFDTVRTRAMEDRIAARATLDQADALYVQRRKRDALPLYDILYRRWPDLLKSNPDALQRYGDVLFDGQELSRAGEIDMLLYNLFPLHRHAGTALVRLGDVKSRLGQRTPAELFYTAAKTQYADTSAAAVARMRLSRIDQEIAALAGQDFLRKKVEGMIRGAGPSYLESSEGEEIHKAIAREHKDDMLGSEALFHLAEQYELRGNSTRAIQVFQDVTRRSGVAPYDPWPQAAGLHLASLLKPQLESALASKSDVQVLTLFHSHGRDPEQYYAGTRLLLEVADTHRRLGFSTEAIHLYQTFVRNRKVASLHEAALIGLGESYLDQSDPLAARNVFESFRLQYPLSPQTNRVSRHLTTAMLEQGDRQSAVRVMRQWARLHPRDAAHNWIYVTLARTLAEDRRQEEAAAAFEDAVRHDALRSPQDYVLYADLLTKMDKPKRASELYSHVFKTWPGSAEAEWAWAQIMMVPGSKHRQGNRSQERGTAAESDDPLLHRAVEAVQTGLQASAAKEGE
jgi:TolA-binding protein